MSDGIDPVLNFRPVYFKSDSNSLKKQSNSSVSETETQKEYSLNIQTDSKIAINPESAEIDNAKSLDNIQMENLDMSQSLKKMQRNFIEIMRIMHPQDPDSIK
jgi:hypothetical protein